MPEMESIGYRSIHVYDRLFTRHDDGRIEEHACVVTGDGRIKIKRQLTRNQRATVLGYLKGRFGACVLPVLDVTDRD
jgi:hypothetical protein